MTSSPLDRHAATPRELAERIAAERRGASLLVYRDGNGRQVLVDLDEAGDTVTIGRRPGDSVCLRWDPEVSRLHARLERIGSQWTIDDDGLSRNGTFVNGERVARRRLISGDTITIGATALAFSAPDAGSASAPTITARGAAVAERVTAGQRRVLVALCRPFNDSAYAAPPSNRQIADELVVSVDAVKRTLRRLFADFGIDDLPQNEKRAQLALEALRTGVITRHDLD